MESIPGKLHSGTMPPAKALKECILEMWAERDKQNQQGMFMSRDETRRQEDVTDAPSHSPDEHLRSPAR